METKDIFDQMAQRYDSPERIEIAKIIAQAIRNEISGTLSLTGKQEVSDLYEKSAMDYGCGTGLVGFELMDRFRSFLFVDVSPQMIKQVKEKLSALPSEGASTFVCDFNAEQPDDLHVDYIFMSQILLHVKDYLSLLGKLHGMLNKEGHLIIVDFDKNENVPSDRVHNGFDQAELKQELEQIGFTTLKSQTFYEGKNIFMNQDASLFVLSAVK